MTLSHRSPAGRYRRLAVAFALAACAGTAGAETPAPALRDAGAPGANAPDTAPVPPPGASAAPSVPQGADALTGGTPRRDPGTGGGPTNTGPGTTADTPLPPADSANPPNTGSTNPGPNPALGRGS